MADTRHTVTKFLPAFVLLCGAQKLSLAKNQPSSKKATFESISTRTK